MTVTPHPVSVAGAPTYPTTTPVTASQGSQDETAVSTSMTVLRVPVATMERVWI